MRQILNYTLCTTDPTIGALKMKLIWLYAAKLVKRQAFYQENKQKREHKGLIYPKREKSFSQVKREIRARKRNRSLVILTRKRNVS